MSTAGLRVEFQLQPTTELDEIRAATDSEAVELDNAMYTGSDYWHQHLTVTSELGGPALRDRLSAVVNGVIGFSAAEFDDNTYYVLVQVEEPEPFVVTSVGRTGAIPHRVCLFNDHLSVTASVSDWSHLRRVADRLKTDYQTLDLLHSARAETMGFPLGNHKLKHAVYSDIPTSQLELLQTAHQQGYFDVPRSVTTVELAETIGISQSTLSERLRRAQDELLGVMFRSR
ncbi:MAG: putative DNA binding protein [halophilic archaeon J07HX64]|jgi:Predicted DNA binding protein|nr:MAG: putative DNA binding protein [halophilic archaeon J07HX64]